MKVIGIIPSRYGASRFPGKGISDLNGKPVVWHVYRQVMLSAVCDEVYVATDDSRIADVCEELGISTLMTGSHHLTGTDRLVECLGMVDGDIIVNIQGDEPMIDPDAIKLVARAIMDSTDQTIMASNGYERITDEASILSTNCVKVIFTKDNLALSYSRLPIPYSKEAKASHYKQLGLYAFRREGLETFGRTEAGPVELSEGVEMLRFLEAGCSVKMVEVEPTGGIAIDTPEDLAKARERMPDFTND